MPSMASYYLLKHGHPLPGRFLDIQDPTDKSTIVLGACLNRIICREVELLAFSSLQETLTGFLAKSSKIAVSELSQLMEYLGRILHLVRWRLSVWQALGKNDGSMNNYTSRVSSLSKTLYFYLFVVRARLVSLHAGPVSTKFTTSFDHGSASQEVYPTEESLAGFRSWMGFV